jgi:GxxExxY protein
MDINEVSGAIVDSAMKVHSALGPGLLESAYQACLAFELVQRGLSFWRQLELPILYLGQRIDTGYRIDLLVEDVVIVEVKAVEKLAPLHESQLLTYLKLSDKRLGLLLNFNVQHMKDGVKRMAHNLRSIRLRWLSTSDQTLNADLADTDFGEELAVARFAAGVLAATQFLHDQLRPLLHAQHLGCDACARDGRSAELQA